MEKRAERRHRTLAKALLIIDPSEPAVECVVRDISANGAGLWLHGFTALPERFDLMIPGANLRIGVQLAWQCGRDSGVEFVGSSVVPLRRRVVGERKLEVA